MLARADQGLRQERDPRSRPQPQRARVRLRLVETRSDSGRKSLTRIGTTVSIALLFAAAFVAAAAHALVAQNQFRLNALQAQEAAAASQEKALQLRVAQMEAPQRVVWVAEHRLGMVVPTKVTYVQASAPVSSPARVQGRA